MTLEEMEKRLTALEDLEAIKNQLSNMLLGDAPKTPLQQEEQPPAETEPSDTTTETPESQEDTSPPLPEPPVVVHVKAEN